MTNLQDILLEFADYNVGCRIVEGCLIVDIFFDKNWSIIEPNNPSIIYDRGEVDGEYVFCASLSEVSIDELFEAISITVNYNLDLLRKVELFRQKVDELREIFGDEDLATLQTLEFKMKRKKRAVTKSSKVENIIEEVVVADNKVKEQPEVQEEYSEDNGVIYNEYHGEEGMKVEPLEEVDR